MVLMKKNKKLVYEIPIIIPLGELARGAGAKPPGRDCSSGNGAKAGCGTGSGGPPKTNNCNNGSTATTRCSSGGLVGP